MKLAYTSAPGKGDMDLLLHEVAMSVIASGLRPAGTAQINTDREDVGRCDMDVLVLPDGPVVRISQSLGAEAKGCRLDPIALERAVALVEGDIASCDCLIINKFGKHEAEGRGFRAVIGEALARDIPVLVGLNGLNSEPFDAFSGGIAQQLAPDADVLADWLKQNISGLSPQHGDLSAQSGR